MKKYGIWVNGKAVGDTFYSVDDEDYKRKVVAELLKSDLIEKNADGKCKIEIKRCR